MQRKALRSRLCAVWPILPKKSVSSRRNGVMLARGSLANATIGWAEPENIYLEGSAAFRHAKEGSAKPYVRRLADFTSERRDAGPPLSRRCHHQIERPQKHIPRGFAFSKRAPGSRYSSFYVSRAKGHGAKLPGFDRKLPQNGVFGKIKGITKSNISGSSGSFGTIEYSRYMFSRSLYPMLHSDFSSEAVQTSFEVSPNFAALHTLLLVNCSAHAPRWHVYVYLQAKRNNIAKNI